MFAITTRNKLRSRAHFISMVWAWKKIRKQLGRSPGVLAYTTGVSSATEFFTLTLWEKEIDMTMFMSSDDHRDMMWNFRNWSESFWSMRWDPTGSSTVLWNGIKIDFIDRKTEKSPKYVGPGYMQAENVPEKLRPYLNNIIRKTEPETIQVGAVIARLPTVNPMAIHRLNSCINELSALNRLLRNKVAVGWGDCLILLVRKHESGVDASQIRSALVKEFPGIWAMEFQATDFEVGHWDLHRFRELEAIER